MCELERDLQACLKHNIHNRSEKDIQDIIDKWEEAPRLLLRTDPTSMLQSAAIEDVEMKDADEEEEANEDGKEEAKEEETESKKDDEDDGEEEVRLVNVLRSIISCLYSVNLCMISYLSRKMYS